jgi:hypothetical protein
MFAVETYAAVRAAFNVALRFFGGSPVNLARETRIAPRGEGPRDFPLFCQRISFFPDVAEHEAVTAITARH